MYRQDAFIEDRREVLLATIRDIQFAAIVTPGDAGVTATHAPMAVREEDGRLFLESHVARGNEHWRRAHGAAQSLAIFQGPQAYVSPSYYPSKQESGRVVPTWAYIVVHAQGRLRAVREDAWLARHLEALTDANEATRSDPWAVSDAPERYIAGLSRGIVGLSLEVERLEGSWKLNQHKPEADRAGTAAGLAAAGGDGAALSAAMAARSV